MKKVIGADILLKGLMYLNKTSDSGYSEYSVDDKNAVAIFSPRLTEKVLIQKQNHFLRGITYTKLRNFFGNGLLTSNDPEHFENRRIIQRAFYKKYFDSFSATAFVTYNETLQNISGSASLVNISDSFSFNCVSQSLFKKIFPRDYIRIYHENSQKVATRPHLHFDEEDMKEYNAIRNEISNDIKSGAIDSPVVGIMRIHGMSEEQILDEVMTLIGAGFETTSATILWALINLEQRQDILERLRSETPSWVKDFWVPEFDELFKSELLNNVIKETLRLYPPAYFKTLLTKNDVDLEDVAIQENTSIFLSQYVAHRDERYYNNPEEWNPDRWTPEFEESLPKGSYYPFGLGTTRCVGEHFSKVLIYIFISMFIHKYDFNLIDGVPEPDYGTVLNPGGKVMMQLTERN
jgi:cytochrome P450